ncbi:diphthamide biosynthesis [Raphidocelis subcapitata]|uniref:2-(3-amino-3-carboxypropyl)histidine synthase subunit 1 n=1 Tax=Raphidocelis subcapitata TaxID=307507 RepID=A0A2V0NZS7_9CHLO|nr:diphthamide biosynthesis [Raphidocelis subcapitata]|eukprot:GBF93141.1 diphthamide biosynthesis [Raphidocelis subcapitata]
MEEDGPPRFSGRSAGRDSAPAPATAGALVPHAAANAAAAAAAAPPAAAAAAAGPRRFVRQQVPDEVLNDPALNAAMAVLPANYNFEIPKTVWRLRQAGAARVALQFPEGLLMYACAIADILQEHAGVEHAFVMGDVAYGACCVDDFSAAALGADFLVHYGHSCLVPVGVTNLPCLYVFVDIQMDVDHLVDCVRLNFPAGTRLLLAGTIQFSSAIQVARARLAGDYPSLDVPKCKPLSPGEVLGCTAPVVPAGSHDALVFVADGRFHLEAMMIANPWLPAYRYDPYGRQLFSESYDHAGMRAARRAAVEAAARARRWGLVMGTLGRQGNPRIVELLESKLAAKGLTYTLVLLSELSPQKLEALGRRDVDAWVQVACPRLSIDWGEGFVKPTLTPFEALVALGEAPAWWARPAGDAAVTPPVTPGHEPYPMDYYAAEGGEWNSSYHKAKPRARPAAAAAAAAAGSPAAAAAPAAQ